jgi:hypothetical protein
MDRGVIIENKDWGYINRIARTDITLDEVELGLFFDRCVIPKTHLDYNRKKVGGRGRRRGSLTRSATWRREEDGGPPLADSATGLRKRKAAREAD